MLQEFGKGEKMIEVKISGVAIDPITKGFVVILKDEIKNRWLPIWVGPYEAKMISLALEKIEPKRPLPHDLMKNMLNVLNVVVTKIVICNLEKDTYFSTIILKIGDKVEEVDARPSDAIALALRMNVPIYVTEEILKKASTGKITIENENEIKIEQLKEKMQKAVEKENYEAAAKLRDKIKDLEKNN